MIEMKNVLGFYVILILSFTLVAILIWWVGGAPYFAQEATKTIAGGIFGGLTYAYFERAFIKTDC